MRFIFSLFVLFASLQLISASDSEDDVIVLGQDSFQDAVNNNANIMVEFYAPWCGHCKQLAPEYANAATVLKGEVPLAKVDCTQHKELCNANGVKGFPTLKLFQDGKALEYQGQRNSDLIVSFIRKHTGPPAVEVSSKNVDIFETMDNVVVLGLFADRESVEAKLFQDTAAIYKTEYQFGITSDADIFFKYGVTGAAALIVIAKFNDAPVVFDKQWSANNVADFISSESFPTLGEIGPDNYQKYLARELPLFWVFVSGNDMPSGPQNLGAVLNDVKSAVIPFKGKVSAVYLDGEKYGRHRNQLGHNGDLPGAILEDAANHKKYKFEGTFSAENVESFLQGFVDGTLAPFLKSEEIPTTQDGSVVVVVGKSFESIVFDNTKDVLVEFYAPWCGHCKSLAPTYETLAQNFKSVSDLVIAKVDVTANDVPEHIEGFPTLIFYPKDNKAAPIKYSGDRSLSDLTTFLQNNSYAFDFCDFVLTHLK